MFLVIISNWHTGSFEDLLSIGYTMQKIHGASVYQPGFTVDTQFSIFNVSEPGSIVFSYTLHAISSLFQAGHVLSYAICNTCFHSAAIF